MMQAYLSYVKLLIKRPLLLFGISLICILLGIPALQTQVSNNMEEWFPSSSPQLISKRQFIEEFGSDEIIFLLLTFPQGTSALDRLEVLDSLESDLAIVEGIDQIISRHQLASIPKGLGLRSRIQKLETLFFDGKDSLLELVYIRPQLKPDMDAARPGLLGRIHLVLETLPADIRTDLTGSGVIFTAIEEASNQESGLLFGLAFIVVFVVLGVRLRYIRHLGKAVGVFLLMFWPALSLFSWLRISVNLITMVVPILFIINFFAYILHLLEGKGDGIEQHIQHKLPPIIYSALTTMIGFGSLMLSDIQIIQHFGLLTTLGTGVGLVVMLLVGVAWLMRMASYSDVPKAPPDGLLAYYRNITPTMRKITIGGLGCLIGAGVFLFPQIKVDTNSILFLPPTHPVRVATRHIEESFGIYNITDFLIQDRTGAPLGPEAFGKIRTLEDSLSSLPRVNGVVSFNTWRSLLNRIKSSAPDRAQQIKATYLTEDRSHSRMSLRMPLGSVGEMEADLRTVEGVIDRELRETSLEVKAVGYLPIYIEHVELIVEGMLKSLGIALLCIGLAMILMVGDIRLGLLAMIPNTFPLFGIGILMALTGLTIDIATSIIGSVIIGLVVDDTLHIIWSFKEAQGSASKEKLVISLRDIIRPSTSTTLMFVLGFSILMFSNIKSLNNFGLLLSIGLILGWIGDFIIFPALLRVFSSEKDNVVAPKTN